MAQYSTGNETADKVLTGALTLAVLYGGYKVINAANNFFNPNAAKDKEQDKAVEQTTVDTNKLQYQPAVYKRIAELQFNAMNLPGTDEAILFSSLNNLNAEDLKQVYKDFGRREPDAKLNVPFSTKWGDKSDLFTWYSSELNEAELARMRNVWKNTGLWN